jgi:hypothetical protein
VFQQNKHLKASVDGNQQFKIVMELSWNTYDEYGIITIMIRHDGYNDTKKPAENKQAEVLSLFAGGATGLVTALTLNANYQSLNRQKIFDFLKPHFDVIGEQVSSIDDIRSKLKSPRILDMLLDRQSNSVGDIHRLQAKFHEIQVEGFDSLSDDQTSVVIRGSLLAAAVVGLGLYAFDRYTAHNDKPDNRIYERDIRSKVLVSDEQKKIERT